MAPPCSPSSGQVRSGKKGHLTVGKLAYNALGNNQYKKAFTDPEIRQRLERGDVTQDFQVTVGGYISYGARDTEFGGFRIPGTNYITKAPDSAFLWLTYFFEACA